MTWEEEQKERLKRLQEDEALRERIVSEDEQYLAEFEAYMHRKKWSERSIQRHMVNLRFYLLDYLLYDEYYTMQQGAGHAIFLLKYDYPGRKYGASQREVDQMMQSLMRFYKCMVELGHITQDAYDSMLRDFDEELDD